MHTNNLTWSPIPNSPTWHRCDQYPQLEAVNNGRRGWTLFCGGDVMGSGLSRANLTKLANACVNGDYAQVQAQLSHYMN